MNIHSDGLPNEQHGKRTHLAMLHRLLAGHAAAIMATPRPIPRVNGSALCPRPAAMGAPSSCAGDVTAFVFGSGSSKLTILENKAGAAAGAPTMAATATTCNASSFPVDMKSKRYKGLKAAANSVTSAAACVAACCAKGASCTVWQFYGPGSAHKPPLCWLGDNPTLYEGAGGPGFVSRARHAPPPSPGPRPPPPGPAPAVAYNVSYEGKVFELEPASVMLVGADGTALYSSAKITAPLLQRTFAAVPIGPWNCWSELAALMDPAASRAKLSAAPPLVRSATPMEQLHLTTLNGTSIDVSEYLLYSAKVPAAAFAPDAAGTTTLEIASRDSNAFVVFVNEKFVGQTFNAAHHEGAVTLKAELNESQALAASGGADDVVLSLLSVSLGMYSHVRAIDRKGIVGTVTLGGKDITAPQGGWLQRVGLDGEYKTGPWTACSKEAGGARALTWWRTEFTLPVYDVATTSVLLDATGLTRGHFRLNGNDLGKFWTIKGPSGKLTQRFYHLPSALLKRGGSAEPNVLVLADEMGPADVASVRGVFSEMK